MPDRSGFRPWVSPWGRYRLLPSNGSAGGGGRCQCRTSSMLVGSDLRHNWQPGSSRFCTGLWWVRHNAKCRMSYFSIHTRCAASGAVWMYCGYAEIPRSIVCLTPNRFWSQPSVWNSWWPCMAVRHSLRSISRAPMNWTFCQHCRKLACIVCLSNFM